MNAASVTRHAIEVLGRSVHYRRCGHGPPVVLLHASPRSSAALLPLMSRAPQGRTVFAFDTPGCGDSAPLVLHRPADVADYGDALAQALTVLGIPRAAVFGTHTGAAIAVALAVRHPGRVAGLVLDGLSAFTAAECESFLDGYMPSFAPENDGTHLTRIWSRLRDQELFFPWQHHRTSTRLWRPLRPPAQLQAATLDLLRAGDHYRAPYEAAFRYQPQRWMAPLSMPVFVGARTADVLHAHLGRLGDRPEGLRLEVLPADTPAWSARLWQELSSVSAALPPAPPAARPALPGPDMASTFVGPAGAQLHLRGSLSGNGRPLILLHDSPGGARCLDEEARKSLGNRPVVVPDLPAHGDSHGGAGLADVQALATVLDAAWKAIGVDEADVQGFGSGSWIAAACAALWPQRYRAGAPTAPGAAAVMAPVFETRPDGGHLQAAWLHARDEVILGPAWSRDATARYDFGESLAVAQVHLHCVEILKESPEAPAMRRALLRGARDAVSG